ncbi:Uncharacterised protein [uncultured archaeon]|nr:Uncharacterised protein [uncultured archaeon]
MLFQFGAYGGSNVFQYLYDWGLIDALLRLLLIFVLIFAVLQRVPLFQTADKTKPDRRINGVLALIIAAMAVIPHILGLYPETSDPVYLINAFLPHTAVILVAILCVILLLGLAGGTIPNLLLWAVALFAVGLLVFIILMAVIPGYFPTFDFLRDPAIQALLIILTVLGLVGYFVLREPSGPDEGLANWLKVWVGSPPIR